MLRSYFPGKRILVLDLESQKRNFWILMLSIRYGRVNVLSYLITYIRVTKPQLVISLQDNFPPLWHLHGRIRNSKVVLIQNGIRISNVAEAGELGFFKQPQVDYYFCFNSNTAQVLSKEIVANFVPHGSFRSNHLPRLSRGCTRSIAYVSTYRPDISLATVVGNEKSANPITYGELLQHRVRVIQDLMTYCKMQHLEFKILGKDLDHKRESAFYASALAGESYELIHRMPGQFHYQSCDVASLVVSTSSTLGLESLGRANRTAILNADSRILDNPEHQFGWPDQLPQEGPFWSTLVSSARTFELTDYLLSISETTWLSHLSDFRSYFPQYDAGNQQMVNIVSKLVEKR